MYRCLSPQESGTMPILKHMSRKPLFITSKCLLSLTGNVSHFFFNSVVYVRHLRDAKESGTRILDSRQCMNNNYLEIHQRPNGKIYTRISFLFQYFFTQFMYDFYIISTLSSLNFPLAFPLFLKFMTSYLFSHTYAHKHSCTHACTYTDTSCGVHLTLSICIFL